MTPEDWFNRLSAQLVDLSGPSAGAGSGLIPDEQQLLLDLARIAAHSSERWTAPLSTYLLGMAMADLDPDERVMRLRGVVATLDNNPPEPA